MCDVVYRLRCPYEKIHIEQIKYPLRIRREEHPNNINLIPIYHSVISKNLIEFDNGDTAFIDWKTKSTFRIKNQIIIKKGFAEMVYIKKDWKQKSEQD